MGEAVLREIAKKRGLDITVDSCGTGAYHVGEDPDDRTVATCKKHGVPISHKARAVDDEDYTTFTHILAADGSNLRALERNKPRGSTAEVRLWGSYHDNEPIGDPYYGGINGFETVYQQCVTFSNAFLDDVFGKSSE
ncbi:Low molecular weight phosphotyrosine protein phosphatase [Marasmius tenuissimus]|uniref:Low molecular weight phosphotyrosine protein phosphatase n=1 Tax=Marasmius tenuissimus TaxID=585030 RepID=A0ABR3ADY8_9AGAR|nr:Low molecular weight phosphotyrosine protein phosphatase [Marasmius tenuissimus]